MEIDKKGHLPFLLTEDLFIIKKEFSQTVSQERSHNISAENEHLSDAVGQDKATEKKDNLIFHGTGSNGLLLILDEPLNDPSRDLLSKMLQAVKFSIDDTAIVIISENRDFSLKSAYDQVEIQRVMYFGATQNVPKIFSQDISSYYPLLVDNKFVIVGDSLVSVSNDVESKKKLWESMKKVFH